MGSAVSTEVGAFPTVDSRNPKKAPNGQRFARIDHVKTREGMCSYDLYSPKVVSTRASQTNGNKPPMDLVEGRKMLQPKEVQRLIELNCCFVVGCHMEKDRLDLQELLLDRTKTNTADRNRLHNKGPGVHHDVACYDASPSVGHMTKYFIKISGSVKRLSPAGELRHLQLPASSWKWMAWHGPKQMTVFLYIQPGSFHFIIDIYI